MIEFAAAIEAKVEVIVMISLQDFPESTLQTYGIEAQHPDEPVRGVIDLAHGTICNVMQAQAFELGQSSSRSRAGSS